MEVKYVDREGLLHNVSDVENNSYYWTQNWKHHTQGGHKDQVVVGVKDEQTEETNREESSPLITDVRTAPQYAKSELTTTCWTSASCTCPCHDCSSLPSHDTELNYLDCTDSAREIISHHEVTDSLNLLQQSKLSKHDLRRKRIHLKKKELTLRKQELKVLRAKWQSDSKNMELLIEELRESRDQTKRLIEQQLLVLKTFCRDLKYTCN